MALRKFLPLIALVVGIVSYSRAALKDDIEAANTKFMAAFASGDATNLGPLYTENCRLMPTGTDVLVGRDAVANVFGGVIKAGAASVELVVDEVGPMGAGDSAYERSHYTFKKSDGTVMDHGKYVVIWKKMNGTWYLDVDIFNSNSPPS